MAEQQTAHQAIPDGTVPAGSKVDIRVEGAVFLPNGCPAPYVLDEATLCMFLRLKGNARANKATILRYRQSGRLRAVRISNHHVYRLPDVMEFLEMQREVAG